MSDSDLHPSTQQLSAFSLGQLPAQEAAEVEDHISDCGPCCETLLGLSTTDAFVALLQDAKESADGQTAGLTADASESGLSLSAPVISPLTDHPRYAVSGRIARGGMGDVYRAEHRLMERTVALKVIHPDLMRHPEAVERFRREVRTAAQLSHPNIVAAFDAEQVGPVHFLVMEYIDGIDLAQVVRRRGALPVNLACEYIRQASDGLQHAHERGMVHRDIKPHNLMITPDGTVRILDFGLASLVAERQTSDDGVVPERADLTAVGTVMGTPNYISPEQADDARAADIRSDIYSLGASMYYLLTAQAPFAGGDVSQKLRRHADARPTPLNELRREVPVEVARIVDRMLEKDPGRRFQTPADVSHALVPYADRCRNEAGSQDTDSAPAGVAAHPQQTVKRARRRRTLILTMLACSLLFFGAIVKVVSDHGVIEIRSEVDDLQIEVTQDGQVVRTIDLQTGSQLSWLPTGDYSIRLRDGANDVRLNTDGFEMTRFGRVIVTASLSAENVTSLQSFDASATPIAQDGVESADGGWKITAEQTRSVRLFEVKEPALRPGRIWYRAEMKTEDVRGQAYLEMWVRIPGLGEFFSKGLASAVSGSNGWAEYEIPFLLTDGQQPDLVRLNLSVEGGGTVWIRNIELRGRADPQDE